MLRAEVQVSSPQLRPLQSKPESLTDLVLDAVRDAIVEKTLAPGMRVSEAMLAARLQVSKTPVREALLRLRHMGLVESANGGLHVVQPSKETIRNAYELRAGLERAAAMHAATRRCDGDSAALAEFAATSLSCAKAGNAEGFREFDRKFHGLVARCSGNPTLASAIDDALLLASALRLRDVPATGDSAECASEHVRIAEAIKAGEADLAATAMQAHIEHVMSTVLALVERTAYEPR
jgi:DNA-binding GntR family transcriptional regulator